MKKAHSDNRPGSTQEKSGGSPRLKTAWPLEVGFVQKRWVNVDDQASHSPLNLLDDEGADFLEWEIRLRLFYIQQLTCLKQGGMKEKMEEMKREYISLNHP